MAYRKFTAGRIFNGQQFVTENVLVTTETGRVIDLLPMAEAGGDVETLEGILCPGFVNAHCHTELSHMQGLVPQQTGMVSFLMEVMFNRQAAENTRQAAITKAIGDMYAAGIVAVGDICNTSDSAYAKSASGQLYFHNFIETSGFVPATAGIRFDQAVQTREKFLHYFPAQQSSITPHAPYSVSGKLMQLISGQAPALLSLHNQESQAEEDFIRHKNGEMLKLYDAIGIDLSFFDATNLSSLRHFVPLMAPGARLLLVHNCYTTANDIEWLQQTGFAENAVFCLCPNANLYIGNPLPPVTLLCQSGISICVGTDSLASNTQLNVLAELQTLQQYFPFLTTEKLLGWATLNGAKALEIGQEYGSFAKGSKPGILQLLLPAEDSLRGAVVKRLF